VNVHSGFLGEFAADRRGVAWSPALFSALEIAAGICSATRLILVAKASTSDMSMLMSIMVAFSW
jgi:hypothetical protein